MAQKVSKSSPVVAAVLRSTIGGLGRLSLPGARRVGRGLGALLWRIPNQFRENSWGNIRRCFPELSQKQQAELVRKSLLSMALNIAEAGATFHWSIEHIAELEESAEGEALIEGSLEQGRGVLTLGPHVGNWEYLAHSLTRRYGLVSLYRPPRIAELDTYLRQRRERLGAEMYPANAGGLRRLARALEQGKVVGILPDQEPLKQHGVFAPFFGVPALTMKLVAGLVRRYDPLVIYGFAQRTESGTFRIRVFTAPEGLGDPDDVRAATQLNQGVEQCVRFCPEQYMWSYRRFRTRPPEELAGRRATGDS
jgi:KDO2-lipid IV(A) lauroyltransferase